MGLLTECSYYTNIDFILNATAFIKFAPSLYNISFNSLVVQLHALIP